MNTSDAETGRTAISGFDSFPLGRGVRVLDSDANGLVALEKPGGVLSHPNSVRDRGKALLDAFYDFDGECYHWETTGAPGGRRLWLLNRLDSATSGVILCALNPEIAAAVREEFASGRVKKTYRALVFGVPRPTKQRWTDSLAVERKDGRLRTRGGGKKTATASMLLRERFPGNPEISLLELTPETGRTHQLRVQCARRKLPVVGDKTYGDFRANRTFARATGSKRLFLHCSETAIEYRLNGRTCRFRAVSPLPDGFAAPRA